MLDGFLGWRDGKTSKIYTRKADRATLAKAVMERLDWGDLENILPHFDQGGGSGVAILKTKH